MSVLPPLSWLVLSMAAGVFAQEDQRLTLVVVITIVLAVGFAHRVRPLLVIMMTGFCLGYLLSICHGLLWERDAACAEKLTGQTIHTCIREPLKTDGQTIKGVLAVDSESGHRPLLLQAVIVGGKSKALRLEQGQQISVRVIKTSGADDRDWRSYLRNNGWHAFAMIDASSVRVLQDPSTRHAWLNRLRSGIVNKLDKNLPEPVAAVVTAMAIGDASRIDASTARAFKTSGLAHVLVVSGLNLSVTAGVVAALIRFLTGSYMFAFFAGCTLAWLYAEIVGSQVPARRAALMLGAALIASAIGKPRSHVLGISYAVLFLLLVNPLSIRLPSFQLSFGAVIALMVLPERLLGCFRLERSLVASLMMLPVAAQLALAPLLVSLSGRIAPYTIFANIAAAPVASVLTVLVFIACIVDCLLPGLSRLLWYFADGLASYIIGIAGFMAKLPGSEIDTTSFTGTALKTIYPVIWAVVILPEKMKQKKLVLAVCFSLSLLWVLAQSSCIRPDDFTISILDVGQGDAALVQTKQGKNILIDTGEGGERITRKLRDHGVGSIDVLVLTHPHADHIGGAQSVFEEFTVHEVLDTPQLHSSSIYRRLLTTIEAEGSGYRTVKAGKSFNIDDETKLYILGPPKIPITDSGSDANNNSLVALIQHRDFRFLLPGDIQEEAETRLLASKSDLKADVLKVPHHGSRYGCSEGFLGAVSPSYAVISVGKENDFGHPAPETLTRLKAASCRIYQTNIDGDISFGVNEEDELKVSTEL